MTEATADFKVTPTNPLFDVVRGHERTVVYIDGYSLFVAQKIIGSELDFAKLRTYLDHQCDLIRVNYFTSIAEDDDYTPLRPLVDWMEFNGFSVHRKTVGRRPAADPDALKPKPNVNVELAVEMLQFAQRGRVDHVILFADSADLCHLVKTVQDLGCRVTVVSTAGGPKSMVSEDLRKSADCFVELRDLVSNMTRNRK